MLLVKRGELTDASKLLARERGPVARIMRVAIECVMNREITMKSRESEIARVGAAELRYLESHLRGLEMTSTVAPLLGLMGTVIGMIASFATLSQAGSRVDPSMLAGGIWEALITTVGGLCVAIPALAAYYLIDAQIEKVRATMRDVTIQILALEDMFIRNEKEQEKREVLEREERLRALREEQIETPIIFLTARANVAHRVEGLSIGGDDYLTKPFAVDELKARLAVLHKRHPQTRKPSSTLPPGWHMNPLQRRVTIKGRAVDLQPREWSLLEIMMANEGEVLTKTHLLAEVWGLRFDPGTNVVDAVICRLRRKLDVSPTASHIETIRGRGYIFRSHA
jgi:DNA-binding response OmpR family regulator/biopolymer transport protein ExbB/TolQ